MKKIFQLFLVVSLAFSISCSEVLPPLESDFVQLNATLHPPQGVLRMNTALSPTLMFTIKIQNNTGEVLEGPVYYKGYIEIDVVGKPGKHARFDFVQDVSGSTMLLPSDGLFPIHATWDQNLDNGKGVWTEGNRLDLRAKGEIQVFRHLGIIEINEIQFTVEYYSN